MGNYPHTAQDFKNAESHTFGSIVDSWVTGYNYDAAGGQIVHSTYRKNFKICNRLVLDEEKIFLHEIFFRR